MSAVRKIRPMSHRLLLTSSDQRRGRAGHTISDAPRTPPPPDGLTAPERAAWRELWASPVSVLWTSDDAPAVVRLIRLRARIDVEGVRSCPVSLFSQVGQLEDRLALNPRARRQARGAWVRLAPYCRPVARPCGGRWASSTKRDRGEKCRATEPKVSGSNPAGRRIAHIAAGSVDLAGARTAALESGLADASIANRAGSCSGAHARR